MAWCCIPYPVSPPPKPTWLSTPSYSHLLSDHPTFLSLLLSSHSPSHLPQLLSHSITTGLAALPYPSTALLELSALSPSSASLPFALRLFRLLLPPTIFSYNVLLRAFSSSLHPNLSLHFFIEMLLLGFVPNKYSFPFVLKSLPSSSSSSTTGHCLHGQALKLGLLPDPYIDSSLIHFYVDVGYINHASNLFERTPEPNVVCWSALLSGFIQWGRFREASDLFYRFQREGLDPNESMLVGVLTAAAQLGALQQGQWVHAYLKRRGVRLTVKLGTALVNMYCRCGAVEEAREVFDSMDTRNVLSWTAIVSGMAVNGLSERAVEAFDEMVEAGVRPDAVAFVAVLTACSHGGLVDEGRKYFDEMWRVYGLKPEVEHYGCMVDLLGRAGRIAEAMEFLRSAPVAADAAAWSALLNACRMHRDLEMGEHVGRFLVELDPLNDAHYVLLANVYSQAGDWSGAVEVRRLMRERGVKKRPGCSVIEVGGAVYEFFASDPQTPQTAELEPVLVEMGERLAAVGYVPSTASVLLDVDEEEKRRVLCYHSEKLAIAFGLINVERPAPIRVVKNLRACVDCHSATKMLSKIYGRVIVVRDRMRFHHFKDGVCSCSDYW